ncbi:hypothetical protein, variant [Aphanomyces invadans]|uniref:Receptor expression-enhancing protein n=1 Tax=Aphanomyces invadans TaxID=157072 RepID=A0A024U8W1_9STRA|nr:hypothetical protein H310_06115 [Aphanomyces invadans]XP_008869261.1 hypothetical protein, variant [Aphanomyces invadans]ETW02655.1 hypothetical protein H310_06115 [Aphanomyces invadans]ETW02656.1 hypothetical protein, variant [Aphanomyces invadans]|eukprot:XP_008869260.1 hypothetical protein H310_06115 [Aphanomyces invadans]
MLVGRLLSRTICNVLGYAYPIYMSVQSAKKEDATDEHIQWVVFWTVNACFAVFEILVDFLGNYIPFYYEAKVCMVAWLALPQFRGALQIYDTLIAPSFVKYEKTLDAHIDLASDKLSQLCRDAASLAMQKGAGAIVQGQQYIVMQAMQQAWKVPTSPMNAAAASSSPPSIPTSPISTSSTNPMAGASSTTKLTNKEVRLDASIPSTPLEPAPLPPPVPTSPAASPNAAIQQSTPDDVRSSPSRQDKEAELLGHFRVLLSRGLKVRHHTKSRLLRLSPSGNYLFLESKNNRGANAPAVLSLLAIQLVDTIGSSDVYLTVETHAEKVTVEAEAKKTRDLLVAGLRLLAVAFQKQGKRDLTRLAEIAAKQKKQLAFDNLLVHCNRRNTNMRLY